MKTVPGYEILADVLQDALDQAQSGKGKDRHAKNHEPFDEQQIMEIARRQGNISGQAFQAHKKLYEAEGMFARGEYARARHEILGAIVYASAMVLVIDENAAKPGNVRNELGNVFWPNVTKKYEVGAE